VHWRELSRAIEEFRLVRRRTIAITAGLSDDKGDKRARNGKWSAAEVLDHLVQTEIAFRKYERQALEQARAGITTPIRIGFDEVNTRLRPLPSRWMPLLTPFLLGLHAVTPFAVRLLVMRKPGLVWAAAPKISEPIGGRAVADLRVELTAEIAITAALFEGELPAVLPRIRAIHPLYGRNDIAQVIRLMAAHEQRHQHQLTALLKGL